MKSLSNTRHLLNLLLSAMISAFLLMPLSAAQATLLNADFSSAGSGFDNWQADVTFFDGSTDVSVIDDVSAFPAGIFSQSAGTATLTTLADGGSEYWAVNLFQDLTLGPLAANTSLILSLEVLATLSDATTDFFYVQLRDLDTNDVLDLSSGGSFDVSSWVGINATFEFGVLDNDFVLGDSLQVGNITFEEVVADVSEPAMILPLGLGLLLLARSRKR